MKQFKNQHIKFHLFLLILMNLVFFIVKANESNEIIQLKINIQRPILTKSGEKKHFDNLLKIGQLYQYNNNDSALFYHKLANNFAIKHLSSIDVIRSNSEIAWDYYLKSEYVIAVKIYEKSILDLDEINGLKKEKGTLKAELVGNLGGVYWSQGLLSKALDCFYKCYSEAKKLNNLKTLATSLGNIGLVYHDLGDYKNALKYQFKAMDIHNKTKDEDGKTNVYMNVGNIYLNQEKYNEAYSNYIKCTPYFKKSNNLLGLITIETNLGELYTLKKQYKLALQHFNNGLEYAKNLNLNYELSILYHNIGTLYYKENEYKNSIFYINNSLRIAKYINSLDGIKSNYEILYLINKKQKNFPKALEYFELFKKYHDSVYNEDVNKNSIKKDLEFEFENIKARDSLNYLKDKQKKIIEIEKQKIELKTNRKQKIGLGFGFFLLLILIIIIYNRLRLIKRQSEIIIAQKQLVDIKNKEITDSINYAEKIQQAILPSEKELQLQFNDSFIFYKPKDIVSGDFFWLANLENESIFSVADCTGHGVPGGFLTMLGNSFLNEIILEKKETNPSIILNLLHYKVIETFKNSKNSNTLDDGMDIIICKYNHITKKITFSGAKQPLYLLRNDEVSTYKTDHWAIGSQQRIKLDPLFEFKNQQLTLNVKDQIYILSDGIFDQFGGYENIKFGKNRFLSLLLNINKLNSFDESKDFIKKELHLWQGNHNQIDDQLIVGIKI